jgi:hypothetical protein
MTVSAWVMMLLTMPIVTSFTLYFFLKVLRTPAHPSQDLLSPAEESGARERVSESSHTDKPIPLP